MVKIDADCNYAKKEKFHAKFFVSRDKTVKKC